MRRALKIALIVVSAVALIALAGVWLYRYFIDSRIRDGGRMENPDVYRAGKDLIEFTWQQNHMNSCKCFSLKFYRENDMPLLTGRFLSRENGETRESGTDAFSNPVPWQLTWVQWFDLQNMLAESNLPEYRKPSPAVQDETDSEILVIWRTDDGNETQKLSGGHAEALETLVLDIAEEAYAASKLEPNQYAVRETAALIGIYWDQNAPSARDCFSFLLDGRTLLSGPEKQVYFSYRYQDSDGNTVFRKNTAIEPEKAQEWFGSIAKELRMLDLPAYRPGTHMHGTTDSCITATWTDGDTPFINCYDAQAAQAVYALLAEFAEETEAWVFSRPVPENGWRCPSCGMPNGSNVFCAECGTGRPAE